MNTSGLAVVYIDRPMPAGLDDLGAGRISIVGPELVGLKSASGVLAGASVWGGDRMDQGPQLTVISRTGIGYDGVDLDAATERGIVVCNAPDSPTVSTAEHALSLMLHSAKSLTANQRRLRDQDGDYFIANEGIELAGRTLGLVGLGRIGKRVARVAAALEMKVVAHDPYLDRESPLPVGVESLMPFEDLLARSDVISVHCPLTDATGNLFDANSFARMRIGVVFINTARGGLVDQEALLAALDDGRVRFAGLDVTDPEPLPSDHPLLNRADVMVTPHIASATDLGRRHLYSDAIDNVVQALNGNRLATCVNPQVYELKGSRG